MGICWGSKCINIWIWGDTDNQATTVPEDEPPLRTGRYSRQDLVEVASGLSLSLFLAAMGHKVMGQVSSTGSLHGKGFRAFVLWTLCDHPRSLVQLC